MNETFKPPKFAKVRVTVEFLTCNQTLAKAQHQAEAPTIRACQEAVAIALELSVAKYAALRAGLKATAKIRGSLGGKKSHATNGEHHG